MVTKREMVLTAIRNENWVEACKLAKEFRRDFLREEGKIIGRAFEMTWNAKFYEALGYNAEIEMEKAKAILLRTYGEAL